MTNGKYDTEGHPQVEFEPGSDAQVLKNKLGITAPREMDDLELDLLSQLYEDLPERINQDQTLAVADLQEWHRRWLGKVYEWAGEIRAVNMSKGGFQFAAVTQLPRLLEDFGSKILEDCTPCNGMNDAELTEAVARVHIEFILIHPFREGNGRLARVLANIMALQGGKPELDFSAWDQQKDIYIAAIQAGLDNYRPMEELVKQALGDEPCEDE